MCQWKDAVVRKWQAAAGPEEEQGERFIDAVKEETKSVSVREDNFEG